MSIRSYEPPHICSGSNMHKFLYNKFSLRTFKDEEQEQDLRTSGTCEAKHEGLQRFEHEEQEDHKIRNNRTLNMRTFKRTSSSHYIPFHPNGAYALLRMTPFEEHE